MTQDTLHSQIRRVHEGILFFVVFCCDFFIGLHAWTNDGMALGFFPKGVPGLLAHQVQTSGESSRRRLSLVLTVEEGGKTGGWF